MSLTEKKQNNDKKAPADCGGSDGDKLALEQRGYVLKLAVASFGLASILHLLLLLALDRGPREPRQRAVHLWIRGLPATRAVDHQGGSAQGHSLQLDLSLSSLLLLALAQDGGDDDTHHHADTWAQWFLLIPLCVLFVLGRKAGLSALAVVGGQLGLILHPTGSFKPSTPTPQASPPTAWADGIEWNYHHFTPSVSSSPLYGLSFRQSTLAYRHAGQCLASQYF